VLTLPLVHAAADDLPDRLSVATWNVEWFFDNYRGDNQGDLAKQMAAPSYQEWQWRLDQVARVIAEMKPTILCMQEVENREVLYRLCRVLEEQHSLKYRIAFIPGYDFGTEQQVVILYRSGLVEYSRREQSVEMYNSGQYYNLSKHIFARFEWGQGAEKESLLLAGVHLKATPESLDVRQKQMRLLRQWLESSLVEKTNVIALGDFNAEDAYGDEQAGSEMMILRKPAAASPEMIDLTGSLKPEDRLTHMIGKPFDRIVVSQSLIDDDPSRRDFAFASIKNYRSLVIRGEKDIDHRDQYYQIDAAERDVSDHYPLMAEFLVK
jgi:endonuclease/exonuclease/phosphatase family metal-dependent hydrolase